MANKKPLKRLAGFSTLLATFSLAAYQSQAQAETFEQCLLRQAMQADGGLTLAEIRAGCTAATDTGEVGQAESVAKEETTDILPSGAFEDRIRGERAASDNRFVITPHKPNYILPMSYNWNVNTEPYQAVTDEYSNSEIKFQLSLKAPLWRGVFNGYGDLYVAYTNTSWWQAYSKDISAPFRETNHEPEAFFVFPMNQPVLGMNLRGVMAGISHQSNGRSGSLSRSWNRIYANFFFERENFYVSFKPWLRIKEDEKDMTDPDYPNTKGDDNPDIIDYMGHGELHFGYKFGQQNVGVMVRNNFSENKGAAQLDWSFPLTERFRGYVQYFNGYGESLIDYDASVNRFSVGVMLTDWL